MTEDVKLFLEMKGNASHAMLDEIVSGFQDIAKAAGVEIKVTTSDFRFNVEKDPYGEVLTDAQAMGLSREERARRDREFWDIAEGFAFAFRDENEIYKHQWVKVGTIFLGITLVGATSIAASKVAEQSFEKIAELAAKNGCDAHMNTDVINDLGLRSKFDIACRPGSKPQETSDPISGSSHREVQVREKDRPKARVKSKNAKPQQPATKSRTRSGHDVVCPPSSEKTLGKKPHT